MSYYPPAYSIEVRDEDSGLWARVDYIEVKKVAIEKPVRSFLWGIKTNRTKPLIKWKWPEPWSTQADLRMDAAKVAEKVVLRKHCSVRIQEHCWKMNYVCGYGNCPSFDSTKGTVIWRDGKWLD